MLESVFRDFKREFRLNWKKLEEIIRNYEKNMRKT